MDIGDMAAKAKGAVEEHGEKAKEFLAEHGDKVADAVDRATDVIDEKTGHRFTHQLDAVDEAARKVTGGEEKK